VTLSLLLILAVVFSVGLCVGMVIMEVWSSWHRRECQLSDTPLSKLSKS
jgi:uncharacterized membrane protein YciS (DUF1049 family)